MTRGHGTVTADALLQASYSGATRPLLPGTGILWLFLWLRSPRHTACFTHGDPSLHVLPTLQIPSPYPMALPSPSSHFAVLSGLSRSFLSQAGSDIQCPRERKRSIRLCGNRLSAPAYFSLNLANILSPHYLRTKLNGISGFPNEDRPKHQLPTPNKTSFAEAHANTM